MDLGYENIVDRSIVVWLVLAYLIHLAMVFAQAGLALFLIASGAHGLLPPGRNTWLLRRLGKARIGAPHARLYGGIGIVQLRRLRRRQRSHQSRGCRSLRR